MRPSINLIIPYMRKTFFTIVSVLAITACTDSNNDIINSQSNAIVATIADTPESRTTVDGDPADGVVGLLWTDGDQLGVFDAQGANHTLYQKEGGGSEARATFSTKEGTITPRYAYYPYSAENIGRSVNSLSGTIPSVQKVDGNNIDGDWKYGVAKSAEANGAYRFEFRHLFSLVKVDVNASESALAGENLKSIEVTTSRGDSPVAIAGDFTFNARTGVYNTTGNLSSSVKMAWEQTSALSSNVSGYLSLFPSIKSGDKITFKVTTDRHIATFTVTSKVNFSPESIYLFPLTLSRFQTSEYGYVLADPEGNVIDTPTEPSTLTGTFTAATYNVDGLPNISGINKDGPQEEGTVLIANAVNNSGWDFFGVSEDFEYHSTLLSGLTNYNAGTWRGTVTSAQLSSRADTDGLCLFWNKDIKTTGESYYKFEHEYGGVTGGANTCIAKGFRYYLVTLKDGTEIDVYITHMNTYSSGSIFTPASNWLNAANGQLTEIADHIKAHQNKRPIVVMGDTNCRYTRHLVKTNLIDAINADSNLEIVDPWCSIAWGGDFSSVGGTNYPAYGGKSIMVSDATGTNADTDVIISEADGGLQKGEVVDKVFYINCRDAKTQIKAKSYLRDVSFKKADGSPLADHYPIVVEFEYTTAK